jgi:predicted Zn finger-like uncharacterized protein
MIINCEDCGKRYRIDESKIVKDRTLFKCTNCKSTIEVLKPKQGAESPVSGSEPSASLIGDSAVSGSFQTVGGDDDTSSERAGFDLKIDHMRPQKIKKTSGLTVGKKLLLSFLAFILITGVILTVVYIKYIPSLMHDQINLRTYSISQSFSAAIRQPLLIKNYLLVNKIAETNAKLPGVAYVYVLNKRRIVIAGILGDIKRFAPGFIETVKKSGFPKKISTGNRIPSGKNESAVDFSAGGQMIHDVAVMIGGTGGEAHVGLFTEDVEKAVRESLIPLLVLLAVIAIMGCLSFLLVARTISTPIKSLTKSAEKISLGEFDLPIEVRGGGEIGELGASLERMRFSIQAALNRLRSK